MIRYSDDGKQKRTFGAIILMLAAVLNVACGTDDRTDGARDAAESGRTGEKAPSSAAAGSEDETAGALYDEYAEAEIGAVDGSGVSGIVLFNQRGTILEISGRLAGLTPGQHGLHIHENGDCSGAAASNSGSHLSPERHPHGSPESPDAEHHAGDLGNIEADEDGFADFQLADSELRVGRGPTAVNGLAIVVHANPDDLQTQPDGNAGAAVGCAVIDAVPQTDYVPEGE